jgi:phage repressor protein C with HTH and peptisase S24 domain
MKAIERIYKYLSYRNITPSGFEKQSGLSNGYLSKQYNRTADIGESMLMRVVENCPDINPEWLLTGRGEMLRPPEKTPAIYDGDSQKDKMRAINETMAVYEDRNKSLISIPIVDVSAAAGNGFFNPDSPDQTGEINIPASMLAKRAGNYYCCLVRGDSMYPTLLDRDYIIFRLLHPGEWMDIRDNEVYFIIDRFGSAYVKRVANRLKDGNCIVCRSDNKDVNFADFNIMSDEIGHIYHVECRLSNNMSNINMPYYDRLMVMEDKLNKVIAKLENI